MMGENCKVLVSNLLSGQITITFIAMVKCHIHGMLLMSQTAFV